ncbi:MAG TPA: hypothetical protein VEL74_22200 [Thermoanaerobaculia bacterium]|nr:hypothetical protein [Thermoanaerobaculia bacterium]
MSKRLLLPLLLITVGTGCQTTGSSGPASRVAYFPQLRPTPAEAELSQSQSGGGVEGTLTLAGGCLRLANGEGDYLVIWPSRVRLDHVGGGIRVIDETSGRMARLGGTVRLAGSPIETPSPILSELRQPLPACSGPMLLATGITQGDDLPRNSQRLAADGRRRGAPDTGDAGDAGDIAGIAKTIRTPGLR